MGDALDMIWYALLAVSGSLAVLSGTCKYGWFYL